MDYKRIDVGMKSLFHTLAETGIPLDVDRLTGMIQGFQQQLVREKQEINREAGFTVNLYSGDHWNRIAQGLVPDLNQVLKCRELSSLIRKLQQIYDLAKGNFELLDRPFGLYPKYALDVNGKIMTISELALSDFPEESLSAISRQGMTLIKATYLNAAFYVVTKLSRDSGVDIESFVNNLAKSQSIVSSFFGRTAKVPEIESEKLKFVMEFPIGSTAMDLAKLGFINLFEDYRAGKLGAQFFAISPYSIYLFVPDAYIDLMSSICQECLESAHTDFTLNVHVTTESLLNSLG